LRIAPLIPGKPGDRGRYRANNREIIEAVLYVARAGCAWRDLPADFGNWNTTWRRFNRWCRTGVWERLFETLTDDPDFEYVIVDANIVRAHQHWEDAKGGLKIRLSTARAVV
jgi:transposase